MKKSITSKKSGTDLKRLDAMKDEDIDFSDLPEATSEMFARGVVRPPLSETEPREQFNVIIDRDVFNLFQNL